MSIILNETLNINEAMKIIREKESLEFSNEAISRVKECSEYIEKAVISGTPIYGVTTGLGANYNKNISREETKKYQEKILRSHAVSVGNPASKEITRAIMLAVLLNGVKGYSGVRIETLETYREALNKDIYIWVPEDGSVGYLSLEAHIALALIGEGKIWYNNEWKPSKDVLAIYGIKPMELSYKEALFLISGTTSVLAYGIIGVHDIKMAFQNFQLISAMSVEVNLATVRAFDERLMKVRKQYEQQEVAEDILFYLKDSEICQKYYAENLQDSLSFRCIPQLAGPVKKKINEAEQTVLREMNSCTDNPILYKDKELEVISGCNPDSSYIGLEMDCLAISLCMLAKMSERRTFRMLDEKLSNKPAFLIENSGSNSGLMITQYTQAGLLNEMKLNATPAIIDNIPTCANQEDYVAMGYNSCKKIIKQIKNLNYIMAIELLAVIQANYFVDVKLKRSSITEQIYQNIGKNIPKIEEDVKLSPYIEFLYENLSTQTLIK